jgi:hypothetical protein
MATHKMKRIGSKAEVWHSHAMMTSGGLKKSDLMKTRHNRIVSKRQHAAGKKAIKRLFKLGYKPKKGTFKAFKKGMRTTRRRGGAEATYGAANAGDLLKGLGDLKGALGAMGGKP